MKPLSHFIPNLPSKRIKTSLSLIAQQIEHCCEQKTITNDAQFTMTQGVIPFK